jgi:replicative superfamily II helicase
MSAEIVLGTISNVKEAVNWLAYTYLYVRMIRNQSLYGIDSSAVQAEDPTLIGRR